MKSKQNIFLRPNQYHITVLRLRSDAHHELYTILYDQYKFVHKCIQWTEMSKFFSEIYQIDMRFYLRKAKSNYFLEGCW